MGKEKQLIIDLFKLGGIEATQSKVKGWCTALDNPRASEMPNSVLMGFIQGLFEYRELKMKEGITVFNFQLNKEYINKI